MGIQRKTAGILLLAVWLAFAVCNFLMGVPAWGSLAKDLENENTLRGVIQDVEEFTQKSVLLKYPIVECYGLLQKTMGKREMNNFDLVKDRLGYLHSGNFYVGFGDDQRTIAVNYRRLLEYCAGFGTKAGVVITPMKTAPENGRYPGIPYNSFLPEANTLLSWLRYYNVPCLDLTELPEESGLGYEGSFYKTDHHWTTPAAFYGYCRILDWLAELDGKPLEGSSETRKAEYYSIETDWIFGSQGRRAGLLYSGGIEPFSVYYPRNDGEYALKTLDNGKEREYFGGFRGTLADDTYKMKIREDLYGSSSYDLCFLHGLHDLTQIENYANPEGLRILLLCDSYSKPLGCFLAQNVSHLDLVYNLGSERGNVLEMVQENQYDYVIACLYPENLSIEHCRLFGEPNHA